MAEMHDFTFATRMRDVVTAVAENVVTRLRPADKFATVTVASSNGVAYVTYPGESLPVPVACGSFTVYAGQRVRISGVASDRHISEVMAGWVIDSLRNPIIYSNGNETRGNALVYSRYRIDNGWCTWYGQYYVGTTTSWAAGGNPVCLLPPVPYDLAITAATNGSYPLNGACRAYNGTWNWGFGEAGAFIGGAIALFDAATVNTPWAISTAKPFSWGAGQILGWAFEYPLVPA